MIIFNVTLRWLSISLFTDLDIITKILEPYTEKTYTRRGLTYIIPKDSPFSEIHITFQPIGLGFEKKYLFVGRLVVVDLDDMSDEKVELYRIFKGMECELVFKGFIRKNVFFQIRKKLLELKDRLEGIKIDQSLANKLNANHRLLEILKKVNVACTLVMLKFTSVKAPRIPEDAVKGLKQVSDIMEVSYYYNPLDIVWEPVIEVMLTRSPSFKNKVLQIYEALNMIGEEIAEFVKEYQRSS